MHFYQRFEQTHYTAHKIVRRKVTVRATFIVGRVDRRPMRQRMPHGAKNAQASKT